MNSPEKSKLLKRSEKQMLEHKQEHCRIRTKTHRDSTSDGTCTASAAAGCSVVNARLRTSHCHSNQKDLPSV
jgi:hypothetical protein